MFDHQLHSMISHCTPYSILLFHYSPVKLYIRLGYQATASGPFRSAPQLRRRAMNSNIDTAPSFLFFSFSLSLTPSIYFSYPLFLIPSRHTKQTYTLFKMDNGKSTAHPPQHILQRHLVCFAAPPQSPPLVWTPVQCGQSHMICTIIWGFS